MINGTHFAIPFLVFALLTPTIASRSVAFTKLFALRLQGLQKPRVRSLTFASIELLYQVSQASASPTIATIYDSVLRRPQAS